MQSKAAVACTCRVRARRGTRRQTPRTRVSWREGRTGVGRTSGRSAAASQPQRSSFSSRRWESWRHTRPRASGRLAFRSSRGPRRRPTRACALRRRGCSVHRDRGQLPRVPLLVGRCRVVSPDLRRRSPGTRPPPPRVRRAVSTPASMRVPRTSLAVPGRRAQYSGTGPESLAPRAASGRGGGRLRRPGAVAGEERA